MKLNSPSPRPSPRGPRGEGERWSQTYVKWQFMVPMRAKKTWSLSMSWDCSRLKRWISLAFSLLCFHLHSQDQPKTPSSLDFKARYHALTNSTGLSDSTRLHQLFSNHWEYTVTEFPETATAVGYPGQDHRWTDQSLAAIGRRKQDLEDPLQVLQTINPANLSAPDRLNYDLFKRNLLEDLAGTRFPGEFLVLNQLGGVQQDIAQVISMMPAAKAKDLNNILARLKAVPRLIEENIRLLEKRAGKADHSAQNYAARCRRADSKAGRAFTQSYPGVHRSAPEARRSA